MRFSIYSDSEAEGAQLRQVVDSLPHSRVVEAGTLADLPAQVDSWADVVLLEYQEDNPALDDWIGKLTAAPKGPALFLCLPEVSTRSLWKALRLGARECFALPIDPQEFQQALRRLPRGEGEGRAPARLIVFLGSKGGVGTSFITTNVAYLLAQERQEPVLLIDLDLHYGQLNHFFDVRPRYTVMDFIENCDNLGGLHLPGLFHSCHKDLHLLAAPARMEEAESVTPDHLEKILRHLKDLELFSWILVDAGRLVNDLSLKVLELSSTLVLVATPLVPALSNAKKLLQLLPAIGLDRLPVEVLLNCWQKDRTLPLPEIAKFLGQDVRYKVHDDRAEADRSINEGRLLAEAASRHQICRDLRAVAAGLAGAGPEDAPAAGWNWLRRLRGKC